MAQSGRNHLVRNSLTYRNALHMHISTRLNFGLTMPECAIICIEHSHLLETQPIVKINLTEITKTKQII